MGGLWKKFYNLITDKKVITLFTTLVNIKCLVYYVFSNVLFSFDSASTIVFTNEHFVASIIVAICDLWLCCGFIHSYVKTNSYNEYYQDEETQSALEIANLLKELHYGNIVSSGIYSFDYVTQIEKEAIKGDEIWCITGDLEEDSKNSDLGNIISNNLKKGVVYRYFITRVGETISNKASWGEQTLREANLSYKNRLMFVKVKEELIAPDIDIIIYKANRVNERIGFVCVEIGDDQNKYIYQQIDKITLQGICDKLTAYDITKKESNIFKKFYQCIHNIFNSFVENLSIPYFLVSAVVLAVLSFSKIVSLMSAVLFLVPAILEFLITLALLLGIMDSISKYKEMLVKTVKNEETLASIINSPEIISVAETLRTTLLDTLMHQKGLGSINEVFNIDENCSTIWILSDLSHDIANQNFYNWLNDKLNIYSTLECHILYPKGTAAVGRTNKLKRLRDIYDNRVKIYPIVDISAHYIWSQTHGIIFFENMNKQNEIYVSLGGGNDAFYKNVITTEEEASTLLGRLTNIAGIEI